MATAFRWQIEGKLAGMGFPFVWDGEVLRERGIGAIINLSTRENNYKWITDKDNKDYGYDYMHLPTIENGFGASVADTEKAIKFIDDHIENGIGVAVHCDHGHSRTGTLLACYLVSKGYSPRDAIDAVCEKYRELYIEDWARGIATIETFQKHLEFRRKQEAEKLSA
jgi:atypical dual specificity phosphatase